ncbi:hypothetical protein CPB86DRAFT_557116 [Serendipita vermifera]|nr:hypothetical protein CPB86DRAFT_557116 [Serendipita vermifera]
MLSFLGTVLLFWAAVASGFKNPIIPGFNPDPSIVRKGNDYFLVTSSFEFFPGVPVYHSKDLIKWEVIGHALNRPSQLDLRGTAPSGGVFAPTLRYNERTNTFYMVTTVFHIINPPDNTTVTPRSMYVSTKNIFDDNAWSDPTYVDQYGFDGDLFFDDDGKTYFSSTFGSGDLGYPDSGYFAIWTTEIDIKTGNSLTESRFQLASPFTDPRLNEAPHIFKRGGKYHLLTADSGTENNHKAMHYVADSVYGPWKSNPNNPLLFNGRNASQPVLATGHADIVQTPSGDWYAVFLATRPQNPTNSSGSPQLGRETFLAPAKWTSDGWLTINGGKDITLDMPGLYNLERPRTWKDDFRGKFADKGWYTQRTPYKTFHKFVNNGLRLFGNVYTLNDRETPAAFFRKQEDLSVVFSTELDFAPTSSRHEAGVTLFLSIWYHNEIGLTLHPETNVRTIFAKTRTGANAQLTTTYAPIAATGSVKLFIKAEPHQYSLGYSVGGANATYIATVENKWLQTFVQGWQNFVGTHFGIYSSANKLPMLVPADFKYVQTQLL